MMTAEPYIQLKEIIPAAVLLDLKEEQLSRRPVVDCPSEVRDFIEVIAERWGGFDQFQRNVVMWSGRDLLLCGIREIKGEPVFSFGHYPVEVPVLQPVDYVGAMLRLYEKKGKAGLVDFIKNKVKDSELEEVLEIMDVEIFHEERPEFKRMMAAIKN